MKKGDKSVHNRINDSHCIEAQGIINPRAKKDCLFWFIPIFIAIAPRLARLLAPYAWFEDSAYAYIAFAMKSGQRPFHDLICVHPPLLESFLSLLYGVFGVSYRVAEIFTALVMVITALLLYDICQRLWGKVVGNVTTALFSFAALLARYHIFEREVFTLAASTFVLWLLIKAGGLNLKTERMRGTLLHLAAGIMCGISLAVKLTGLLILPPIILYLLWKRQYHACWMAAIGFMAVGAGAWSFYLLKYGKPALYQLVFFQLIKGENVSAWSKITAAFVPGLNYLWLIGLAGLVMAAWDAVKNKTVLFVPVVFFVELMILFLFVNATAWPHNLIDFLLPLSIGSGLGIWCIKGMIAVRAIRPVAAVMIGLSIISFSLLGAFDLSNYDVGWQGHHRADLTEVASFVQRNTTAFLPIHAPHHVATEAQRLKLISYDELAGLYAWIAKTIDTEGYQGLLQSRQFESYYTMIEKTMNLWRPGLNEAIAQKKISCAVWDSESPEWLLNYDIDVVLEKQYHFYTNAGYAVKYAKEPYIVWLYEQ